MKVKRADWVCVAGDEGHIGFVRRVARDGSWADVLWRGAFFSSWTKRMSTEHLVPLHTIPFMGGTITDLQREKELEHGEA